MKMARKPNRAGRMPAVLTIVVLLVTGVARGQSVLTANPELWGINAHQPAGTASERSSSEKNREVVVAAQLRGILKAARRAEKKGSNADAGRLYEQALQLAPTDRTTLLSYARMLHRVGAFKQSIAIYYRSLEHHRDDPVAMNDLALCYARKGELRHALAMMTGAVSLKPDSKRYRNNIAKLLLEMGRPNDAFGHLVAASGPAIGHLNMAKLLSQRGQNEEAVRFLEVAVGMDPSLQPARELLRDLRGQSATQPVSQFARLPVVDRADEQILDSLPQPTEIAVTAEPDSSGKTASRSPGSRSTPTARLGSHSQPGVHEPWVPGSIKLQSADVEGDGKEGLLEWSVGVEEIAEQDISVAPVPFDSPFRARRYTEPESELDPVGSYLDGFKTLELLPHRSTARTDER